MGDWLDRRLRVRERTDGSAWKEIRTTILGWSLPHSRGCKPSSAKALTSPCPRPHTHGYSIAGAGQGCWQHAPVLELGLRQLYLGPESNLLGPPFHSWLGDPGGSAFIILQQTLPSLQASDMPAYLAIMACTLVAIPKALKLPGPSISTAT